MWKRKFDGIMLTIQRALPSMHIHITYLPTYLLKLQYPYETIWGPIAKEEYDILFIDRNSSFDNSRFILF